MRMARKFIAAFGILAILLLALAPMGGVVSTAAAERPAMADCPVADKNCCDTDSDTKRMCAIGGICVSAPAIGMSAASLVSLAPHAPELRTHQDSLFSAAVALPFRPPRSSILV